MAKHRSAVHHLTSPRRMDYLRVDRGVLREQAASIHLLKDITQAANEAQTIEQVFQVALDRICQYTRWPVGHALTQWGDAVISSGIWHLSDAHSYTPFRKDTERRTFGPQDGIIGRVMACGEAVWVADLASDPSFIRAEAALRSGLRAAFAFPVLAGDRTVGVLEFFNVESGRPKPQLVEVMRQVGTQLGRVVEREMAREALEQSREQLQSSIESMIDAFVILEAVRDERSRIVDFVYTYANEAACRANHISREALLGMHLLDLLPAHRTTGLFDAFCQVVESGEPLIRDGFEYIYHWDGRPEKRALDMRGTRLSDGLAYTWRDVTERKRIEAELTEVEHRMLESVERERLNLAQELHDGPIQDLYGADFQLHTLEDAGNDSLSWDAIEGVHSIIHEVIQKLRETCGELRPTALAPFGLQKAILSHAERFQETYPDLNIQTDLAEDGETLPHPIRLGLFRIYQQLMINAVRHAHASRVVVRFNLYPDRAVLRVEDDGVGFKPPARWVELVRDGHYGLMGSLERAQALGGRMEIHSAPGQGTEIQVVIPLTVFPKERE